MSLSSFLAIVTVGFILPRRAFAREQCRINPFSLVPWVNPSDLSSISSLDYEYGYTVLDDYYSKTVFNYEKLELNLKLEYDVDYYVYMPGKKLQNPSFSEKPNIKKNASYKARLIINSCKPIFPSTNLLPESLKIFNYKNTIKIQKHDKSLIFQNKNSGISKIILRAVVVAFVGNAINSTAI